MKCTNFYKAFILAIIIFSLGISINAITFSEDFSQNTFDANKFILIPSSLYETVIKNDGFEVLNNTWAALRTIDKIEQAVVAVDVTNEQSDAPWSSAFIGLRVEHDSNIHVQNQNGIWFGFRNDNSMVVGVGNVTEIRVMFDIGMSFQQMKRVYIIDKGNSISVYIKDAQNNKVILTNIEIQDSYIVVKDRDGITKAVFNKTLPTLGYVELVSHFATSKFDNFYIGEVVSDVNMKSVSQTAKLNDLIYLPQTVEAQLNNGLILDVPVAWKPSRIADTAIIGQKTYTGSIEGFEQELKFNVNTVSTTRMSTAYFDNNSFDASLWFSNEHVTTIQNYLLKIGSSSPFGWGALGTLNSFSDYTVSADVMTLNQADNSVTTSLMIGTRLTAPSHIFYDSGLWFAIKSNGSIGAYYKGNKFVISNNLVSFSKMRKIILEDVGNTIYLYAYKDDGSKVLLLKSIINANTLQFYNSLGDLVHTFNGCTIQKAGYVKFMGHGVDGYADNIEIYENPKIAMNSPRISVSDRTINIGLDMALARADITKAFVVAALYNGDNKIYALTNSSEIDLSNISQTINLTMQANRDIGSQDKVKIFVLNKLSRPVPLMEVQIKCPLSQPQEALDITNKSDLVSICYSLWFSESTVPIIYNNTEILKANPTNPQWGGLHAFHYWAEPALGYYKSYDEGVIKTHLKQLQEANIDFIILDWTNYSSESNIPSAIKRASTALLKTALQMRQTGEKTPSVVFWVGGSEADKTSVAKYIYNIWYQNEIYKDLFVFYNQKPLILTTLALDDASKIDLEQYFTTRHMWGLQRTLAEQEWSFLQPYPQKVGMNNGQAEQISVSVAYQQTYMSYPTAITRRGGQTFKEQWQKANEIRPKIITITWWNEWMAQRFEDEQGNTRFVDNYTREASRDIEPMKGGHGDLYYQWMKQYIKAYKEHLPMPQNLLETQNYDN